MILTRKRLLMDIFLTRRLSKSLAFCEFASVNFEPCADHIAFPLTQIINSFISNNTFPAAWKMARVSPIPKVDSPVNADQYRPIAILPALCKVYEQLVHNQILEFIEQNLVFNERVTGYCEGHSTTTVLL